MFKGAYTYCIFYTYIKELGKLNWSLFSNAFGSFIGVIDKCRRAILNKFEFVNKRDGQREKHLEALKAPLFDHLILTYFFTQPLHS